MPQPPQAWGGWSPLWKQPLSADSIFANLPLKNVKNSGENAPGAWKDEAEQVKQAGQEPPSCPAKVMGLAVLIETRHGVAP